MLQIDFSEQPCVVAHCSIIVVWLNSMIVISPKLVGLSYLHKEEFLYTSPNKLCGVTCVV